MAFGPRVQGCQTACCLLLFEDLRVNSCDSYLPFSTYCEAADARFPCGLFETLAHCNSEGSDVGARLCMPGILVLPAKSWLWGLPEAFAIKSLIALPEGRPRVKTVQRLFDPWRVDIVRSGSKRSRHTSSKMLPPGPPCMTS